MEVTLERSQELDDHYIEVRNRFTRNGDPRLEALERILTWADSVPALFALVEDVSVRPTIDGEEFRRWCEKFRYTPGFHPWHAAYHRGEWSYDPRIGSLRFPISALPLLHAMLSSAAPCVVAFPTMEEAARLEIDPRMPALEFFLALLRQKTADRACHDMDLEAFGDVRYPLSGESLAEVLERVPGSESDAPMSERMRGLYEALPPQPRLGDLLGRLSCVFTSVNGLDRVPFVTSAGIMDSRKRPTGAAALEGRIRFLDPLHAVALRLVFTPQGGGRTGEYCAGVLPDGSLLRLYDVGDGTVYFKPAPVDALDDFAFSVRPAIGTMSAFE